MFNLKENELIYIPHFPLIRRAREFRLYDYQGRRYVDLYRGRGGALLGHKPPRLVHRQKNLLAKGLLAEMPSVYQHRLGLLLKKVFPAYEGFFIINSLSKLLALSSSYLQTSLSLADIFDPFSNSADPASPLAVWRPFAPPSALKELLIPIIPCSNSSSVWILLTAKALSPTLPPCFISPLLLLEIIQNLVLILKQKVPPWVRENLFAASPFFNQQGIYLLPKVDTTTYQELFVLFKEHGFLLSPFYPEPSMLPLAMSKGELSRLTKLLLPNKIN